MERAGAESVLRRTTEDLAKKQAELAERQAKPLKNVPSMQAREIERLNKEIAALTAEQERARGILGREPAEPPVDPWEWYRQRKEKEAAATAPPTVDTPKVDLNTGKVIIPGKPENWLYPQPIQPLLPKLPTGDPKSLYPKRVWASDEMEGDEPKPKITVTPKPQADLTAPATTMLTATRREQAATAQYIASLEAAISRQRELS